MMPFDVLARALGPGYYPHQLSWLIDNPVRRLIISPRGLADRLPLRADSQVLEIGPGSGYFSAELARRVPLGRLELLDLQPQMLEKARRKLDALGITNVGYSASNASAEFPFPENLFDVVILVAVLGEVPDKESCLRQVFRVLRQGGTLAVHEHIPDPDRITPDRLTRLAESTGFRITNRWGPAWNYTALLQRATE